jgi:DNA mismatch repair protein MutS
MVNSTKTHSELKTALSLIADTARLHRSIQRGTIRSADVVHYSQSYRSAIHLSKLLITTPFNQNLQQTLESTLQEFELIFDVEKARKEDQDLGFLQSSIGPKSEQAEKKAKDILTKADTWLSTLKKAVNDPQFDEGAYFKPTDKSMFILHSTKSAQRKLEAMLKQTKTYPKLSIKSLTSNSRIEDPALDALEAELDAARGQLKRCLALEVPQACILYSQATRDSWQQVEDWIVNIDLCLSMARTAIEHGWTQPVLEANHQSRVKIDNLRHPLIEAQKTQSKYVTHSISLGHEDTGWLLYGMNASGKSSLMKAIGIAVLLAQVGSYVPATSMTITPFHKIATRILNQDNLWAGLSSFAVEMSELRDIFQVADNMTLVLGDELCSGTESISATAIVAAGIEWLHKCGTRFVLATHLHDLTRLQRITTLPTLRIWHLHVEYDRVRDIRHL